jgi:alkanesulfonate monooxygenase SsuD/methylene tetrahydromethanopterin reductase-like flavin-dependent oxidoreductase (luciferase family)
MFRPLSQITERDVNTYEFIIRCWTEDSVEIDGASFKILPKPVQKPHPPIYVGTYNPDTARWIAETGYRLIQHGLQPRPHLEAMLKAFEGASGRVADVPVGRYIYVSKGGDSSARQEVWPSVCALTEHFRSHKLFLTSPLSENYLEPERFLDEIVITGSAKTVAEKIKELRSSLGVEYLNCYASMYGYLSRELTLSSLELISKRVIPELAKSSIQA